MASTETRRVELFVRSLSREARNPGTTHFPRLRRLADEGNVDLSVSVWGREVGLSTTASRTDTGQYVLDRVAAFREWADASGVPVEPFFETREVDSGLTGESYTAPVLPATCLAEYRDGNSVTSLPTPVARPSTQSPTESAPSKPNTTGPRPMLQSPGRRPLNSTVVEY